MRRERRAPLEGHHRQADDVRIVLAHQPLDRGADALAARGSDRRRRPRGAAPTLPASDASAPFGMRIVSAGVCSNESGIERSRIRMSALFSQRVGPHPHALALRRSEDLALLARAAGAPVLASYRGTLDPARACRSGPASAIMVGMRPLQAAVVSLAVASGAGGVRGRAGHAVASHRALAPGAVRRALRVRSLDARRARALPADADGPDRRSPNAGARLRFPLLPIARAATARGSASATSSRWTARRSRTRASGCATSSAHPRAPRRRR